MTTIEIKNDDGLQYLSTISDSSIDLILTDPPLQGGKNRFHPTQKSLILFEELIKKHSNETDIILDTFLGDAKFQKIILIKL